MGAKRNAFIMLCNTDINRALLYLTNAFPLISGFDELMQLAIVELIKKDCHSNLAAKVCCRCNLSK
jgi:coatomer subunit beta